MRTIVAVLIAVLPSRIKVALYRSFFGYEIGQDVRIGLTLFLGVRRCRIGDHVRIGHLNVFQTIEQLEIGSHTRIGILNLLRGGERLSIGSYATILRLNVLNSIPDAEVVNPAEPILEIGEGAVVTTGHWLDFTDRISIGAHAIIGGRNSSLWTHSRQRTRPISIGEHCYLGSEVRVAPGVEVPSCCIVALGAVLLDRFSEPRSLIAGNPATVQRPLEEKDLFLIFHKTRPDIP